MLKELKQAFITMWKDSKPLTYQEKKYRNQQLFAMWFWISLFIYFKLVLPYIVPDNLIYEYLLATNVIKIIVITALCIHGFILVRIPIINNTKH